MGARLDNGTTLSFSVSYPTITNHHHHRQWQRQRSPLQSRPYSGLIKRAAFEPTLTGPLLLILTRGPESLREPLQEFLLKPFASNRHDRNLVRAAYIVKTLKWLFALGLAARANDILTAWALNYWRFRKQGVSWSFDERTKKEVALVIGGCSGFGLLVTKGLAGKMKVVVS
jgi:all-trans-retinol dehydrogenase (NAD+)